MKYIKTPFVDAYTKKQNIRNGRINPYEDSMEILWINNHNPQSMIYGSVSDNTDIDVGEVLSKEEFDTQLQEVIHSSGHYKSIESKIEQVKDTSKKEEFKTELTNVKDRYDLKELSQKVDNELPDDEEQ